MIRIDLIKNQRSKYFQWIFFI